MKLWSSSTQQSGCGSAQKSSLEDIVELVNRHQVEFIVVGGQAEVLYGGTRVTCDVDLSYRRTRDNLFRLAQALQEFKPRLPGAMFLRL